MALEKEILIRASSSPFHIQLLQTFQNKKKIFFVLEYCPGGDLFSLIYGKSKISERAFKEYVAQIILALEYLHDKGIVYRDLKPENILIDAQGFLKLTDFGLSQINKEEMRGRCGTPEYFAPEVIRDIGYGKEVDWWSLGCLVYEMQFKEPPFKAASQE